MGPAGAAADCLGQTLLPCSPAKRKVQGGMRKCVSWHQKQGTYFGVAVSPWWMVVNSFFAKAKPNAEPGTSLTGQRRRVSCIAGNKTSTPVHAEGPRHAWALRQGRPCLCDIERSALLCFCSAGSPAPHALPAARRRWPQADRAHALSRRSPTLPVSKARGRRCHTSLEATARAAGLRWCSPCRPITQPPAACNSGINSGAQRLLDVAVLIMAAASLRVHIIKEHFMRKP